MPFQFNKAICSSEFSHYIFGDKNNWYVHTMFSSKLEDAQFDNHLIVISFSIGQELTSSTAMDS